MSEHVSETLQNSDNSSAEEDFLLREIEGRGAPLRMFDMDSLMNSAVSGDQLAPEFLQNVIPFASEEYASTSAVSNLIRAADETIGVAWKNNDGLGDALGAVSLAVDEAIGSGMHSRDDLQILERYAAVKVLYEQGKITDPAQQEAAKSFINQMDEHLDPDILLAVEENLMQAMRVGVPEDTIKPLGLETNSPDASPSSPNDVPQYEFNSSSTVGM